MDFYEVVDQVIDLLRSRGRVTCRALKRQFDLDDEFLEHLKDEIPLSFFGPAVAKALRRETTGSQS